jgi:hypothetical protein
MLQDWRSKSLDTMATGGGLVVINFALVMFVSFVERVYGRTGLFEFAFILMVIAIFCLERATTLRLPETWRARSGILGGLLSWAIVELAHVIGQQNMSFFTEVVVLTLAILVTVTLWKRSFSTGLQFFILTFLFGWMVRIILSGFRQLQNGLLMAYDVLWWAAIVFSLLSLGVIGWVMFRSRTRIQRLMIAVILWFCLMIVIYSLRGGVI